MRLGLSTYSFPWAFGVPGFFPSKPFTVEKLIAYAAEKDIEYVQVCDNCPLHDYSEMKLLALFNLASAANVTLQVGTRNLSVSNLSTYLTIAHTLKSPFLRVIIDDVQYHPNEKEAIGIIQKILPCLKSLGIQLAIENHDRFPAKILKRIIDDTDPEWVGICLDTANSLGAGEGIEEVVHYLAPYTLNLHIKDFLINRVDHKMGFRVSGCSAGSGMLPVPWLLEEISTHKKCSTATLEIWSDPETTIETTIQREEEWVENSISYLKTLIK